MTFELTEDMDEPPIWYDELEDGFDVTNVLGITDIVMIQQKIPSQSSALGAQKSH